jgi:DNA-binding transcriptional ArsR family regulator
LNKGTGTGRIEVTVTMRARDLLDLVERRYGSVEKLRAHVKRHEDDGASILLFEAAIRNAEHPNRLVRLGEALIGDPGDIVAAAKLELLGHLLGRPGIGIRELARGLGKNPATILEQVGKLEAAGLVVKESRGPGRQAAVRPLITELTIRVAGDATA